MPLGPKITVIRLDPHWASALPPRDLIAAMEALDPTNPASTTTLKPDTHRPVLATTLAGHRVVLKREPINTLLLRLKARLGLDKASRQWRGSALLDTSDISTIGPIAIVDHTPASGPASRWLILAYRNYPTVLSLIESSTSASTVDGTLQHSRARALATDFLTMRRAWLVNRDPKPSNILWDDEHGVPIWIDTVGVKRVRRGHTLAWHRSMTLLYIEPLGRGHPPRRTLIARFLREIEPDHTRRLALWHHLTTLVRAHGDPTK